MSVRNSAEASISTDLRSGWGCDTIGAVARRLSEKPFATARASGVFSLAVYLTFFAINCTAMPCLWNTTTCSTPAGQLIMPP